VLSSFTSLPGHSGLPRKNQAYIPLTSEGFIHCSKANQIMRVANTFFTNLPGLVILVIDPSRLKPELRWETGTDKADELFPHIYGPLNLEAVVRVLDFEPGPEGMFSLPSELQGTA
jgi:uncharacterized protein (DUF952 family)